MADAFGDDLFSVFDDEQTTSKAKPNLPTGKATGKHGKGKPVSTSSITNKRDADNDGSEDVVFGKRAKIIESVSQEEFNLADLMPQVKVEQVETVEGCTHEVALPASEDYKGLKPRVGKAAKEYPFILDPFQREALLCIDNNQSVLVSAHTSAGKTVCADNMRINNTSKRASVLVHYGEPMPTSFGNQCAVCNYCKTPVCGSRKTTSNYRRHLRTKHPEVFQKFISSHDMSQLKPDEDHHSSASTPEWPSTSTIQVALTDSIVTFISNGLLPLSTVENADFINVLQLAQPSFKMPSQEDLRDRLIPQRSDSMKTRLFNLMAKTDHICLTVDLWSNQSMRSFLGMACHFLVDFELHSLMLNCQRFRGGHSFESICEVYDDVLDDYNIQNKVSFIVTGNSSKSVKTFTLFPPVDADSESEDEEEEDGCELAVVNVEEEMMSFPPEKTSCFAHSLQLVVREALDDIGTIKSLLLKAHRLIAFCHKSTTTSVFLEGTPKRQHANATCWNNQLKLLRSVLEIPNHVLVKARCPVQLVAHEVKIIQEFLEVMEPFEEVMDRCQAEKAVTSSCVIPCVRGLRHAVKNTTTTLNKEIISTLETSLESQLAKFEDMECFQVAAALDPRFKLDWCSSEAEKVIVKNVIAAKLGSACPKVSTTSDICHQRRKRSKLFSYMESQAAAVPIDSAPHELPVYLRSPCLEDDANPLLFWKINEHNFPNLAALARKYLAIPASSAPVERIFTVASEMFRPERRYLSDKTFEELLNISCNNFT